MMSSVTAFLGGHDGSIAYATSDAGAHARPHALVRELNPQRMTVNCIAPGFIADLGVYEGLPAALPARVLTETLLAGPGACLTQQRSCRPWLRSAALVIGEAYTSAGAELFGR